MEMRYKILISFLIFLTIIPGVFGGTQEQVTNGEFTSSLTGWSTGGTGYAGSTYTSTYASSMARLYVHGGSSGSGWANTYIEQTVDLTNTNSLNLKYYKYDGDYGGASTHFTIYIDGVSKLDYTGSYATTLTSIPAIDVSGYSGNHVIKIYASISNGGLTNKWIDFRVDDVSAIATTTSPVVNSVNGTPLGGTVSFDSTLSVDKTDGYPTSNTFTWTILPATGWSYKTGNANSESPVITINDAGEYQATCVVSNVAGSDSASVNITGSVEGYNLLVNVLDADNSTALTHQNCTVYLWQGDSVIATQYTGNTGNTTFSGVSPDTYTVWASATGYNDNYVFAAVSSNTEVSVSLSPTGATTGGVQYAPHNVKFTVLGTWGEPIENIQIIAISSESSGPLSWLEDWLGISPNIDINGTTLSGSSGVDGTVSFMMIESVKYTITVKMAGVTVETFSIYPIDNSYEIYLTTASWLSDGGNVNEDINISVYGIEDTNTTNQAFINLTYSDASLSTLNVLIHLNQSSSGIDTNLQTVNNPGVNSFTQSFIIHDFSGDSYIVRLNITSTQYGYVIREYSISFPGGVLDIGLQDELYPWIAIFFLIFIGAIFGASSATHGMIIVSFFGWGFYLIGWFSTLGTGMVIALTLATIISIIAILMKHQREAGHR